MLRWSRCAKRINNPPRGFSEKTWSQDGLIKTNWEVYNCGDFRCDKFCSTGAIDGGQGLSVNHATATHAARQKCRSHRIFLVRLSALRGFTACAERVA